jgi:putative transposase
MTPELATYPGYRFPAEVIRHAVWLYHVFSLSLRDVELILAERGISVTHESIRNWCLTFGGTFARKLRRRRPKPGDTWHMDEVYLRINSVLHYLWRAVDQQASCSISWCRIGGTRPQPSASSNTCSLV